MIYKLNKKTVKVNYASIRNAFNTRLPHISEAIETTEFIQSKDFISDKEDLEKELKKVKHDEAIKIVNLAQLRAHRRFGNNEYESALNYALKLIQ